MRCTVAPAAAAPAGGLSSPAARCFLHFLLQSRVEEAQEARGFDVGLTAVTIYKRTRQTASEWQYN